MFRLPRPLRFSFLMTTAWLGSHLPLAEATSGESTVSAEPAGAVLAAPVSPPLSPAAPLIPPAPTATFSGAIGPTLGISPDYSGASGQRVHVGIGYHLRYGRFSASNTGGFVTRPSGEVTRGLGLDFGSDDSWRASVSLGFDNGRRARSSPQLAGTDDVRKTVRLRANVARPLADGWKVGASVSTDAFGRGGGQGADVSVGHDRSVGEGLTWSVGGSIGAASARAMRSWYGISPAASLRSGLPVYTPGAGWRSASLGTSLRIAFEPDWIAFWDVSTGRLLGPAAASPLTHAAQSWRTGGGVAWRF